MRTSLALALLLAGLGAPQAQTRAGPAGTVILAPHRAVYELSLARAGGSQGVESARGRIVFDFTGDACEGYALNYRQVTVLETGEKGTRTSDLRSTTFETGEGDSIRFRSDTSIDGRALKTVDGEGRRRDGALEIRLREPRAATQTTPSEVVFPSAHLKRLIEAARAGRTTDEVKLFDGSDDGRKVYDTLAVIGPPRRAAEGLEEAARSAAVRDLPRWPVTLSYFAPGSGERTPAYVLAFDLYENGIARALRLDYSDFSLRGELTTLEVYPDKGCRR